MNSLEHLAVSLLCSFSLFASCIANVQTQEKTSETFKNVTPLYVEMSEIHPGQSRFSSRNVDDKVRDYIRKGYAVCEDSTWILGFDNGRSVIDVSESLPVVKASFGYLLVDGHHHALAAQYFGSATLPVKIIADLSQEREDVFWQIAEREGWTYLVNLDGSKSLPPASFSALQDDPNRYFAAITARKYRSLEEKDSSIGADYPLWIKIGRGRPFAEFIISDILMNNGLQYDYEMGDNPPIEFVEQARKVLLKANPDGITIVPARLHYRDLK